MVIGIGFPSRQVHGPIRGRGRGGGGNPSGEPYSKPVSPVSREEIRERKNVGLRGF